MKAALAAVSFALTASVPCLTLALVAGLGVVLAAECALIARSLRRTPAPR